MTVESLFHKWAESVANQQCWGVGVGGCTGSSFDLMIGQKCERAIPVNNDALDSDMRAYDGEYVLFVTCSNWLLLDYRVRPTKRITDSLDDCSPGGPLVNGLRLLKGKVIRGAKYNPVSHDLKVLFKDEKLLHISGRFPENRFGYSLFLPDVIVSVDQIGYHTERR